jgi:hypothetical protein
MKDFILKMYSVRLARRQPFVEDKYSTLEQRRLVSDTMINSKICIIKFRSIDLDK